MVTVTDLAQPVPPGQVLLRPASLVVGVGASRGADPEALWELVAGRPGRGGGGTGAVGEVVTLDRKAAEPAIVALGQRLGVAVRTFDAAALGRVAVPNPSAVVAGAVGTPSVAEAAALLAAGPAATLVVDQADQPRPVIPRSAVARRRAQLATWRWWGSARAIRACAPPRP